MRVIGSQFISTMFDGFLTAAAVGTSVDMIVSVTRAENPFFSARLFVTGRQRCPVVPPLRLGIERPNRQTAQHADEGAVGSDQVRREDRAGWLVHKRHEMIREAWHRAADADAANIGTSPDAADPSTFGNIALHNRTPAPK